MTASSSTESNTTEGNTEATRPLTGGVHHVGLTVADLEQSAAFFTELLGWQVMRRDSDYPAMFVSDGKNMLSLWQARTQQPAAFNRASNIGLHHLALGVESEAVLHVIHQRVAAAGLRIEFAPESRSSGSGKHMMCYEPGGIRIEFIWKPHKTSPILN